MSALAPVIHSPLIVFAVWEIGHDPDTQGDNEHARTEGAPAGKVNVRGFWTNIGYRKLRTKHGIDLAKETVHRLTTVRDSNELGASSRISISLKSAPLGVLPLFDDLRFVPEEIAWPGSARLCRVCGIVKRARLQRQTAAADARCKPLAQSDQRIDPTIQNRPPRTR
jgi:hypothetical protein